SASPQHTQRSEYVGARISVLSELPEQWRKALTRWSRWNRRKKIDVDGKPAPHRNEEYLLYQTLLGVWPFEPMIADKETRRQGDKANNHTDGSRPALLPVSP